MTTTVTTVTTVTADTSDAALALLASAAATAATKAVQTHTTLWPSKPLTCDCGRTFRTRNGISRHLKETSNAVSSTWEPEYRRTLANLTATRDTLAAAQTERDAHEQQKPDETDDHCRVPGCDANLDDGEGWDGLCGTHADQIDTGDQCSQCDQTLTGEWHEGYGMCAGCLHNALRSGWTPGT